MSKKLHELGQLIVACETYIVHNGKVLMHKRAENKAKFPGFWPFIITWIVVKSGWSTYSGQKSQLISPFIQPSRGETKWIDLNKVLKLEKIFPPSAYYLKHILDKHSGIKYNASQWNDAQLVRVLSEKVDKNC